MKNALDVAVHRMAQSRNPVIFTFRLKRQQPNRPEEWRVLNLELYPPLFQILSSVKNLVIPPENPIMPRRATINSKLISIAHVL